MYISAIVGGISGIRYADTCTTVSVGIEQLVLSAGGEQRFAI